MTAGAPPTPYKGLAPFEDSDLDASLFFGRERERELITANLMASRLTVLYGASGVGKSSLLRAGVAHELGKTERVAVASSWSGDPLAVLDSAAAAAEEGELFLILDQLEEFFVYHGANGVTAEFATRLADLVRRSDGRLSVLLGIREESLAKLDAFKARLPNVLGNYLRLEHLDRGAAREAIVEPLRRYERLGGVRCGIEPALVEAVLDEVSAEHMGDAAAPPDGIETPYLQLVMQRVWEVERASGSQLLRLETLRALGGAERIVREHLERALVALRPEDRDAASRMFDRLVTPSGAKIAHAVADLVSYAGVAEDAAHGVIARLEGERILRPVEGGKVEIFHDVLAGSVSDWRRDHEASRELRRARRRTRRLAAVTAGALVALVGVSVVAVYALAQRSNVEREARHARARELAALASSQLVYQRSVDPTESLRLALAATALEPSRHSEDVLRTVLRALPIQAVLPGGGPVASVGFSHEGKLVVTAGGGGEARLFRAATGLRVLTLQHGDSLSAAALSPDGSVIATAGSDGVARIWNAATGERVHELKHEGPVTSATFSADGKLLATTSADASARIWRVAGGRLRHRLQHPYAVKSASFSGSGTLLVTVLDDAVRDRVARVFDVRSGRLVSRLVQPKRERVTSARFAPRGDLVVTGSGHDAARVWNGRTGSLRLKLEGHKGAVLYAEFSPEGDRIVTASTDQTARVWDARTGDLVSVLADHGNYVLRAHFSADGESVVTASADRRSSVFDTDSGTVLAQFVGHQESVADAVFSPDGTAVASASGDGTARVWDALPHPRLAPIGRHREHVVAVSFSPDGRLLATAGDDGVRLWRYAGGLVRALAIGAPATVATFSRDGSRLLTSSADGTVRIWRVPDWRLTRLLRHPRKVETAALSPDARLVATADADGTVRLWDEATGKLPRTLDGFRPIAALAFSPDGEFLVGAGADKVVRVWRVADGALVHELSGHDGRVVAASFSPDGRTLVTASRDKTARIWNTATGALAHELRGHRAALTSASFSPDGRLIVTTSFDHDSRVWSADTGRLRWVLRQAAVVNGASFSADGRWLVTAGPAAGVWDLSNGRNLFLLRPPDRLLLTAVAFSPAGFRIATGGRDGNVGTYECQLCGGIRQLVQLAEARLERVHTASRGR